MKNLKRKTQIFKALANINRLKIIVLLSDSVPRTVSDIAGIVGISLNAVSKHLILLHNLDVLKNQGRDGHVFYELNDKLPSDIARVIKLFI